MQIKLLPGLLAVFATALISQLIQDSFAYGGKHPLEATAVAVLLGLIIANVKPLPEKLRPGVKFSDKFLGVGIVLLGASLDFSAFRANGAQILTVIVVTMAVGLSVTWIVAKSLKLNSAVSLLLSVGTTICGGTAIAVIAPIIKSKEEETAYAIGTITIWGIAAIFIYPAIATFLGFTDWQFGVFAGTAIHSTPQVIGAGYVFSDAAGILATGVKLLRNCFIVPVAFAVAIFYKNKSTDVGKTAAKSFPWFLFGYFATAILRSTGMLNSEIITAATESGKFLILLSMAAIGLGTSFKALKGLGLRPIIAGLIGALAVAATSYSLIMHS